MLRKSYLIATLAAIGSLPMALVTSSSAASAYSGAPSSGGHSTITTKTNNATTKTNNGTKEDPCGGDTHFDPEAFTDPTRIDNPWYTLRPRMRFVFKGMADSGAGLRPHTVITTVTDLTKVINGVRTVVVVDQDFSDDQLVESELAFFAQDEDKNVWTLGEYPEEFEDGTFVGAPNTWIAGVKGAQAGILVPGRPRMGDTFLEGFAPAIDFLDCGTVADVHADVCVNGTHFHDVLVIDEFSPLDPEGGHQLKFYAPGEGLIKIAPVGGEAVEMLSRVEVAELSQSEAEAANRTAMELEQRAYEVSKVYRHTPPLEGPTGVRT
jgi:hypothetical protein